MRIIDIFYNHPVAGYMSSALATTLGLLNLLAYVQAVLGVISLSMGIAIAALTLDAQLRKRREDRKK